MILANNFIDFHLISRQEDDLQRHTHTFTYNSKIAGGSRVSMNKRLSNHV